MSKNNKNKENNKENKKLSSETKENIIISLALVLFLVIICFVVYYVIRVNNPNSFKSEEELYEEILANLIQEYNEDMKESEESKEEEQEVNDGTFSVYTDNIRVDGKLPKTMKNKYYIECYSNGLMNIYSKYTYALSQTKYNEPKGIILQVMIANDDLLKDIEAEGDTYTIIEELNGYSVIYIIPDEIQYLEEDDVSRSNYDKLAKYRDEIIDSITVTETTEEGN